MNVSLAHVFGTRLAKNPHQRGFDSLPLISPRFGNRRFRTRLRSMARKLGA